MNEDAAEIETRFEDAADGAFPVGVEYYRAPTPRQDVWDDDLRRVRAAGFRIIRSHSYWNWMEPRPGIYELDDFDRMFDLGEKHGLYIWLDMMLATHGACPEWLTREHPDLRVVNYRGERVAPHAGKAFPQGGVIHCYDHPAWREYGGGLIRHVVNRYQDRRNLLIWGLWDAIKMPSEWSDMGRGYPCYCEHTLARYAAWLRKRFTLDQLNERFQRRYRRWEDVQPPRSYHSVVEMLLYRRFHFENLEDHLRWMVGEVKRIDSRHEVRAHGMWYPSPWDEQCARHVDSWGMSMPSNNLLTSREPSAIADRSFIMDWARSIGRGGRWWNEEIYAGMHPGGTVWKKQSDPRETTALLWLSLINGAAGAMYWQYRPEYLSFESPGYNLVSYDGQPNSRLRATSRAIKQIAELRGHLPLERPPAQAAIVYHGPSHEIFTYDGENERFVTDLRGTYRSLWKQGIAVDIVSPSMDWSGYQVVLLPNVALMDEPTRARILQTWEASPDTWLVAEGNFATYSADGQSSYHPPEGLAELLGVRVADCSAVTELDIERGENVLKTEYGEATATASFPYAVLEPLRGAKTIARYGDESIGIRSAGRRFIWFGFTLTAGFGDAAHPALLSGLLTALGIRPEAAASHPQVVPLTRRSRTGDWLVFLINLARVEATTTVTFSSAGSIGRVHDLIAHRELPMSQGAVEVTLPAWEVGVLHCHD